MRRYNKDKNLGDADTCWRVIALIFIFIPGWVLFFKYILYMEDRYETWGVVLAFSTVIPVAMLLEGGSVLVNRIRDKLALIRKDRGSVVTSDETKTDEVPYIPPPYNGQASLLEWLFPITLLALWSLYMIVTPVTCNTCNLG